MADLKILIADDEPDVLNAMARKIEREGYTVIKAADGEEAWRKIGESLPDIVILDLTMPKMDGLAVLKNLRENPPVPDKWQPVIIVSARGELRDMQKGFSMEADHYITKPCKMEDVIKGIRLMTSLIPQRKTGDED